MSERNVPPRHNDADVPDSAASADQTPVAPSSSDSQSADWEVVPFGGMPKLSTDGNEARPAAPPNHDKTAELHNRIYDLNQCNEVLLSRVHQLEEALERSQQALQQEVERSQPASIEETVAAAQNRSVAELLRDLEQSNAALERQTILAETLTAQLQTYQERSEQLEKESTILRQQHTKTTQQLQALESTCTDLRSRLQRQQRYTLQFKAALEKCLDTHAFHHTSNRIEADGVAADFSESPSPSTIDPKVMPRSERIQPWSASDTNAQTDPNLLSLVRSHPLNSPADVAPSAEQLPLAHPTAASPPPSAASEATAAERTEATNSEAQQQLWQDVERVIDNTARAAEAEGRDAEIADATSEVNEPATDVAESSPFTEPIPWGAPVAKESTDTTSTEPPEAMSETAAMPARPGDADTISTAPTTTDAAQPSRPADSGTRDRSPSDVATSIPALDQTATSDKSPSPVVHPLKPTQRKRKSLSAVELPSFPPLPKVNQ